MGKQYLSVYTTCFFRCSLPKSTKYRTSSIFGTWCFAMLFWNFFLAYFLPLGDSFTVLMRRNCLKVLKLSGNSHWSQYHNITISWYHKITKSQYHLRKLTLTISQYYTPSRSSSSSSAPTFQIPSHILSVCHMISQVLNSLAFPSTTWIGENGHHVM